MNNDVKIMVEHTPSFRCRYHLSLDEAKQGFALATFGKKKYTRWLTPLISIGIVCWGLYLGLAGVGKYYVVLGAIFLILQMLLRFIFLPKMFARQYHRLQFGEVEQGIDLYQHEAVLVAGERQQKFEYADVQKFEQASLCYLLELKDSTVIIVSKQAVAQTGQQAFFESVFAKR